MKYTGLPANFEILAADVPNACAVIQCPNNNDCSRYLLYNQEFIIRVKNATNTDWSAISILVHEIGHHLSGHTLEAGGSRPKIELEADKFSRYILRKMNASLEESLVAIRTLASEEGSSTHPPKHSRLAAITNGWKQADDEILELLGKNNNSSNSTNKENVEEDRHIENTNAIPGKYPYASIRYLTPSDLHGMSKWELKIMRNEIFARHGYLFKTSLMRNYFNNKEWYLRIPKLSRTNSGTKYLSEIEKKNIKLIRNYE